MTKEEQEKMYMKLPKKQLIEMLINCNYILNNLGYDVSKSTVRVQVFPTVELKKHKQGHPSRFPYMQARTERLFHDKH
jgi:hypothetical protein